MARGFPKMAEVRDCLHESRPEMVHPNPVHHDPGEERMLAICQCFTEGEATTRRGQIRDLFRQLRLSPS